MGCWNETCLMSNLPIGAGDPVVAFLIAHDHYKDNKDYSGSCYATDLAFPISLPIEAEYDDYGSIENFNGKSLAIRHLHKLFGELLDPLFSKIHDGELTIPSSVGNGDAHVGLVMVHKKIYDVAVDKISSVKRDEIIKGAINAIEASVGLKKLTKNSKHISDKYGVDLGKLPNGFRSSLTMIGAVGQFKDEYPLNILYDLVIAEIEKYPKRKKSILNEFANGIYSKLAFSNAISQLRKTWMPHSGKGSQNDDIRPHIVLANAIKEVALIGKSPEELYYMFLTKDY